MTVTYRYCPVLDMKVPILHKVVYAPTTDDIQAQYQRSYKDHLVDEWLKTNCKHSYYHGPGYLPEKSIQFECDVDAFWFMLRWAE